MVGKVLSPRSSERLAEIWEGIGWRVKVHFTVLANKVRPKDHIDILKPLVQHVRRARAFKTKSCVGALEICEVTAEPTQASVR